MQHYNSGSGPVVTQIAAIVDDLDAALRSYHHILGWGPWRIYDFNRMPHHGTTVRGKAMRYSMRTAVTAVGEALDFELIEPGPEPSPYREFLQERGPGLHHILCRDPDSGTRHLRTVLTGHGLTPLFGGSVGDVLDYAYHDGGDALNVIFETIEYNTAGHSLQPTATYPPG